MINSASYQFLDNSQAVSTGQIMSYLPCIIFAGICLILSMLDDVSISDVYSERKPLYERFAQNTIDGSMPIDALVKLTQEIVNE